jgi:tether containing UBX domain for GLUT4
MDIDSTTPPTNPLEPVSVFSAPSGTTPVAALRQDSDSAFTPTLAHAQLHQARLLAGAQNKRLKSDAELEADAAAEAARLAAVRSVQVKVRFPDGTSAQWRFGPDDTGAMLYRAVRGVMAHETQPFKMVIPGAGAGTIRDGDGPKDTLVRGHGLRGGVLISLVWDDGASKAARTQPFLKEDVARLAKEVVVPETPRSEPEDDKAAAPPVAKKEKGEGGVEGMAKKLPKWLKLPGKK